MIWFPDARIIGGIRGCQRKLKNKSYSKSADPLVRRSFFLICMGGF